MTAVNVLIDDVDLSAPALVEGFPGIGLVGKIAVDHMVAELGMDHYANIHCDGLAPIATYGEQEYGLRTPVRLYVDEAHDLLALQSDVPVPPAAAATVAECLGAWFVDNDVWGLFLSGMPSEKGPEPPALYGVATAGTEGRLEAVELSPPPEPGAVSGPTGAFLDYALENGESAVSLIAEADPQFPDPEAARVLLTQGVEPLADVEIPTEELVERATEMSEAREELAKRMREGNEDSSKAQPLRMYQ